VIRDRQRAVQSRKAVSFFININSSVQELLVYSLIGAQRNDGLEPGGFDGGIKAEPHSNADGKQK
jgi:hypothetical protein